MAISTRSYFFYFCIAAKLCLCFFTLFFSSTFTYAAKSYPLVENIISKEESSSLFNGFVPQVHVLPLSQKTTNVFDVISDLMNQDAISAHNLNYGFSDQYYWIGASVANTTNEEMDVFFEVGYGLLDKVHFYLIDSESQNIIKEYVVGDSFVFSKRPISHSNFIFPLELLPQKKYHLLLEVKTTSSNQFPLKLWSPEGFVKNSQKVSAGIGALIGMIIILAIYNFFLYISLKEVSFIFIVLCLFSYACVQMILTGYGYSYLWPNSPQWNDVSLTVIANFALAQLCLFSRSFLSLQSTHVGFSRLLYLGAFASFFLSFMSFFIPYKYMIIITAANVMYTPLSNYAAGFVMMLRSNRSAYYYNLAFCVFVIAASIFSLEKAAILPRTLLTEYAIHIGAILAIVLLSFALTDSINRASIAKDEEQQTTIENLEKYHAIYETSLEGMFRFTPKGGLLACNPAFAKMMGVDSEEDLVKRIKSLIGYVPGEHQDLSTLLTMLNSDGHVVGYETICHNLDGEKFWGSIYAKLIRRPRGKSFIDASIVDISNKKNQEEKLSFIASHDLLTGLSNRVGFNKRLDEAISLSRETRVSNSLLFMDLDRFKIVNDTCGHLAGDELLKQLSTLFKKHTRDIDTVARLGGDEFVIILVDCSLSRAEDIANRLREEVSEYKFNWKGKIFSVGISIGIVPVNEQSASKEVIMDQADTACYAAKDAGRNYVVVQDVPEHYAPAGNDPFHKHEHKNDTPNNTVTIDTAINTHSKRHLHSVPQMGRCTLKDAISDNKLALYKQTIRTLGEGVNGEQYELLVRVNINGELMLPKGFIPSAERFGSVTQLDYWVIGTFVEWLSNNHDALASLGQARINVNSATLSDEGFSDYLIKTFDRFYIPRNKICFEISESDAILNLAQVSAFLKTMNNQGFKFLLDDFGAGFSSYSYLEDLPVEALKIDGALVRNILTDATSRAMVKSIIEISHTMGLKVIAAFVESEEISKELEALGVDFMQGYYIHMPEPLK